MEQEDKIWNDNCEWIRQPVEAKGPVWADLAFILQGNANVKGLNVYSNPHDFSLEVLQDYVFKQMKKLSLNARQYARIYPMVANLHEFIRNIRQARQLAELEIFAVQRVVRTAKHFIDAQNQKNPLFFVQKNLSVLKPWVPTILLSQQPSLDQTHDFKDNENVCLWIDIKPTNSRMKSQQYASPLSIRNMLLFDTTQENKIQCQFAMIETRFTAGKFTGLFDTSHTMCFTIDFPWIEQRTRIENFHHEEYQLTAGCWVSIQIHFPELLNVLFRLEKLKPLCLQLLQSLFCLQASQRNHQIITLILHYISLYFL